MWGMWETLESTGYYARCVVKTRTARRSGSAFSGTGSMGRRTSNDGGHIEYICNPLCKELHLRECDRDLYEKMRRLVVSNTRSIAAVEASGALPADMLFFNRAVSFDPTSRPEERHVRRLNWLDAGLREVGGAKVVFADPDNGLKVPSCDRLRPKGPKYVYYDDLRRCWDRGQSLVVYHHIRRKADAEEQVACRGKDLRRELPGAEPIALRYRRRSPRVYFVLPRPEHANRLNARIGAFLESPWSECDPPHFERAAC